MPQPFPRTEAQEVLLLIATLAAAGARVWVSGGWGVDILIGRQTRPHRDLDLAIDASALDPGMAALAQLGYVVETDWLPVRVELNRPGRGWVDLHPVVFDEVGDGAQAGFEGETFAYPRAGLVRGSLLGVALDCIDAELQLSFRQGYPLRDVDRHDLRLLHDLRQPPGSGRLQRLTRPEQ